MAVTLRTPCPVMKSLVLTSVVVSTSVLAWQLGERVGDAVDLVVGELGEARHGDALGRPGLGGRTWDREQVAIRRLLSQCQRIVDGGRHAGASEPFTDAVAVGRAKHTEVVRVPRMV